MSIQVSKVIVSPLRGMDERWKTSPTQAVSIRDMCWSDQDSWTKGGGFDYGTIDIQIKPSPSATIADAMYNYDGNIWHHSSTPLPVNLHWFAQYSGAYQWLMFEDERGRLKYFNGSLSNGRPWSSVMYVDGEQFDAHASEGRSRTILTTPWIGTSFATFAARLYMVNGRDEPLVFDGEKASPAGFYYQPGPPEPRVFSYNRLPEHGVRQQSVGLGPPGGRGAYMYKVTFVNERGQESEASEASGSVKFNNADADFKNLGWNTRRGVHVVYVTLPTGPVGTVARRLYRTQTLISPFSGGSQTQTDAANNTLVSNPRELSFTENFYFVEEIQDNETTLFCDMRNDPSLGSVLIEDDFGGFPRSSSLLAVFKSTMFVADGNDFRIRYSAPNQPEVFPRLNRIDLSDSTSGEITALYATTNALVVFKQRGIYLIKGDPVRGFYGETLSKDVGCIATRSVREIPKVGLVFMGLKGIYILQGLIQGVQAQVVKISQPIRKQFQKINIAAAANIRSVVYHRDAEYWLFVPITGEEHATLALKFHYEIGSWSYVDNFPCGGVIETEDHRGYMHFVTDYSDNVRGMYVYGKGYTTKGFDSSGDAIDVLPLYETANLSIGKGYEDFRVVRVHAQIVSYGTNELKFNFTTNRDMSIAAAGTTVQMRRPLEDASSPTYGVTTWNGGSTYVERRPMPVRYDVSTMHKGPVQDFRMQFHTAGARMELIEYELEVVAGARKKAQVLTDAFGGTSTR
jgi:hypothetical protein